MANLNLVKNYTKQKLRPNLIFVFSIQADFSMNNNQSKLFSDKLKIHNRSWDPARPWLQFVASQSLNTLTIVNHFYKVTVLKFYLNPTKQIPVEFDSNAHESTPKYLTLISTWLKVFPLYTPTMDPTISGRMTMSLRWVLTTSGFSMGGASFLALRRRLRRDCCLRRRPRFSLLLGRAQYSCISCSLYITHSDSQ